MRDSGGNVLATTNLTLAPWMHEQLPLDSTNGLFSSVTADVPTASVYFLSGNPIFAYASLIDNVSGDASFITPVNQTPFTP